MSARFAIIAFRGPSFDLKGWPEVFVVLTFLKNLILSQISNSGTLAHAAHVI